MSILRQIQQTAVGSDTQLSQVLRATKVLASRLNHDALKHWVDAELNGYPSSVDLPAYRILQVQSRGTFLGPFGGGWKNVPLPALSISEKYRGLVTTHRVYDGVAAIEAVVQAQPSGTLHAPWSPDLIALEGRDMMQGFTLAEAWQEISVQSMLAILDTVRNKILDFALELEREVPMAGEEQAVVTDTVEGTVSQIFNITILGGTANVAAGNSVRGGELAQTLQVLSVGDLSSLLGYLDNLGVAADDLQELEKAIGDDPRPQPGEKFGKRVSEWMGKMVSKAASGSWRIAVGAAGDLLARAIAAYYGH